MVLISLILTGCFEPVETEFPENTMEKVVIEGMVNDLNDPTRVIISRITSPNEPSGFLPVENAEVSIKDDLGNYELLSQSSPGIYESENINGVIGATYSLEVKVDDQLYTAREKMCPVAFEDSTYYTWKEKNEIYEEGYYLESKIKRLADTSSFYRLIFKKNDSIYANYSDLTLFESVPAMELAEIIIPYKLGANDTVEVSMYSLSKGLYEYWSAVARITNATLRNSSIPPQNPPSNISGNALGFFQVSSVLQHTLIIR
jgi:hypothetical protein